MLNQLKSHEIEDEGLLVEHDNHHVLSELDAHDELVCVECDLCPVLFLVVIPDDYLVPLLFVNEDDNVGLVHHFNQSNVCVQILYLLFGSRGA